MAGIQRGRNWGITGIVNLGDLPQFTVEVRAFKQALDTLRKNRMGRGQGAWRKSRATSPGGNLVLSGKVTLKGYPLPSVWRGQRGSLVIQYHRGAKETLDIEVEGVQFSSKQVSQDRWDVTISCTILATPVVEGFGGDQPDPVIPTKSDVQLYEGLSKTQDPKGLQDAGTTMFDVWPLGDTDLEENARIAAVIAATSPPFQYAKVKTASLLPNRDDEGGTVTITWSLTDTEEDVVNPIEYTTVDPNKLTSQATTAAVNAIPDSLGGDFVNRETTESELNDQKTLKRLQQGLRDTKDDVEYPQSPLGDDPYDLKDAARICLVTASATAPAVPTAPCGQHVDTTTTRLNRLRWQHVFTYQNLNSEQEIEFPPAVITTDPSELQSSDVQSDVTDSSTPPADPSPRVSGLVLRVRRSRRVGGVPEKWLHTWEYGQTTTEEDVTFPGTVTDDEVSDIADQATVTVVTSSGTPPATPAAPVGQLLSIESEQITDAGKWRHTFKYGNTTALQRIQFPTDTLERDPALLQDEDAQSDVTATSTLPATPATRISGLVLRRTSSVRIAGTPEKWLHRWFFARKTTEQDITFPGTVKDNEVSDIADEATVTLVNTSSTPPATPSAPLGQLLSIESEQLTDAGKWRHTFKYGNTTALQRIQFPTDTIDTDPNELQDEDNQSDVTATSTVPATPATRVVGLVLRRVTSVRIAGTPEKWLHRWFFGRRDTEQDVTFPGTVTDDEVSDIADEATVTLVNASSTPPATPAAPVGQLLSIESEQLTDAGKWRHTFKYGNTTALQRIQFPTDTVENDPSLLQDEDTQSETTATSTLPATPATRIVGLVLRRTSSIRIAGTPEKWLHRWFFGRRTTEEDVTFPGTVKDDEVSDIADQATVTLVNTSSTPPATPAAPVGQLLSIESEQITDAGKWRHTFKYGNTTALQKIQFPTDTIETDPSLLQDEDAQSDVTASSTVPATPATRVVGLVLRRVTSIRIAGTPEKWLHRWFFGRRTTEEDITFPGTVKDNEVSDIADQATVTLVNTSSTPPATPAAPVGQILSIESEQITDAGKWRHTFKYGNTTALQRIQFPTDTVETDPSELQDEDAQSEVAATSTVPATPSPRIAGTVLRRVTSIRIAGTPEKWLHRWFFGRRTTEEDITFPGTVNDDDVSNLGDKATVTLVNESSTPPATPAAPLGQHVSTRSEQITDAGKWKHTFEYANNTNAQNITFPDSPRSDDPNNLQDAERIAIIQASATPPATPSINVTGVKLRMVESKRLAGTPEQWEHVFVFARRNTVDDVEQGETEYHVDPSDLRSRAEVTVVEADDTPDGGVSVTGLVLRDTKKRELHDGAWAITYIFGETTTEEDEVFAGSIYFDDPDLLAEKATVTIIDGTEAYPVTLNTPPAGLKLREVRNERLTDAGKWKHTAEYGLRDNVDDVTMPDSPAVTDASSIKDTYTVAYVTSSSTHSADAPATNYVLRTSTLKQLHDARWEHLYEYGRSTIEDDYEFDGSHVVGDAEDLDDDVLISEVQGSATPNAAAASPPSGLVLKIIRSKQLTSANTKYLHTYHYSRNTTKTEMERNITSVTEDATQVSTQARIAEVYTTAGGLPAAPVAADALGNLVTYDRTIKVLNNVKSIVTTDQRLFTPQTEIEYGGTRVDFSQFDNITKTVTELLNETGDIEALANAYQATAKSDVTIDSFTYQRLNKEKVKRIVNYVDQYNMFGGAGAPYRIPKQTFLVGGIVFVNVAEVVARGTGLYEVLLTPLTVWGWRFDFSLRKRVNASTVPLRYDFFNTVNADTFLNFGATGVTFMGPKPRLNGNIVAPHVLEIEYDFSFDVNGWNDEAGVRMGWIITDTDPGLGLKSAATFGWDASGLEPVVYTGNF